MCVRGEGGGAILTSVVMDANFVLNIWCVGMYTSEVHNI